MLHPPSNNQTKFVELIKTHLDGIVQASLTELGKKLFPIMSSSNIYASMYNCFHTFYTIRINKGQTFEDGSKTIFKYAQDMKDQTVLPKIMELLNNKQFTSGLLQFIEAQLNQRKNGSTNDRSKVPNHNSNLKNSSNNLFSNITKKPNSKPTSSSNVVDISDDSPTQKQIQSQSSTNTTNRIQIPQNNHNQNQQTFNHTSNINPLNSNPQFDNGDPYQVANLMDRKVCLCGKSCALMNPKKDQVFKCYHCNQLYHVECMQRGKNYAKQTDPIKKLAGCAYCHLKDLQPLKQVMKTLFVGVLKQGRKRHGITFNLDMMDLKTKKWRIQVRCFRLKDKIQTFALFPDSASFSINNRFQKQFLPLPKQSSLKYRKDQPFLLTQHLINHENKLTIIQRIPKKQSKDDRIQPENHLLGLYLVQDKQIPSLVKQIRMDSVFTFYQSKSMLDRCFKIGDAEDITCEVVKIPVICTLTIQRIKTPVRGIFCSHYQCFDLNNFLVLTSSSTNPRWLCPLCKLPAYAFKYDIIVGSIIEQYAKFQPTQIMFTKDGQFKVYNNQDVCNGVVTNIHNLSIDGKYKRVLENPMSEEEVIKDMTLSDSHNTDGQERKIDMQGGQEGEKKNGSKQGNKNLFEVPQDANIISLDDD